MTIPIGAVSLTVNTPGVFQGAPPMGAQGIVISNESPFNVVIQLQGTAKGGTLLPETVDFFPIVQGFNGNVTYNPTSVVTNPASYTAAKLSFEVVGLNESINRSSYPIALTRPAVTPTASGKPIFSTTVGFGSTVHIGQQLNVFNPPNSGVNFTFHSVRVFTNDTTTPTANLMYTLGGDLNFSGSVPAVSHDGSKTAPASFSNCTFVDTATQGFTQTSTIEVLDYPSGGATQDLLAFPDSYILEPGGNLTIQMSSGASGKVVRLTMKWSEDIAIAPQGGVPTGVTTSLINDGNPLQNIIESTIQGQSSSSFKVMNDGEFLLSILQSAVLHQVLQTQTSGDQLLLGQSGDVVGVRSKLRAPSGQNLGLDVVTGTAIIDLLIAGTSSAKIDSSGVVVRAGKALSFNGGGANGSLSNIAKSGPFTTSGGGHITVNHLLGAVPDFIIISINSTSVTAHNVYWSNATSTQVDLYSDATLSVFLLCIAF